LAVVSIEVRAYKYNKWVKFTELTGTYRIQDPRFPRTR